MPGTLLVNQFSISPFSKKAASDHEYERLAAFMNTIRQEKLPDDPPVSNEEFKQNWKSPIDFLEEEAWIVWDEDKNNIFGYCSALVEHSGDNEHICEYDIMVHPMYRCQGFARELLPRVIDFARRKNRHLLKTTTYGTIPSGDAFMLRLGAQPGLKTHIQQLKVNELPSGWIEKWLQAGERLSSKYELGCWEGPVPEEHLSDTCALIEMVLRDAPHDQLDEEPRNFTPEIQRQIEEFRSGAGLKCWVMYVRDRRNGRFAGWTECVWSAYRPTIVHQSGTGVYPDYREQGLGHWLKAAMMQKLLLEQTEIKHIRTTNADSNVAMVKINQEMGYKPYTTFTIWQVEREQMEAYLSGKLPKSDVKAMV